MLWNDSSATMRSGKRHLKAAFRWPCIWLLAVLVYGSSIVGLEVLWRSLGHRATVADSRELWSFHRRWANCPDGKAIVLIGASRMHADISVPVLQRLCPSYRVIQLAAYGRGSSLAVLEDLANDSRFSGIILCEMVPPYLSSRRREDQAFLVNCHPGFAKEAETVIASCLDGTLVCKNPSLSLASIFRCQFGESAIPDPDLKSLGFNRNLSLRFRAHQNVVRYRIAKSREYQSYYASEFTPAVRREFGNDVVRLDRLVCRINDRGGAVVFIAFPVSGLRARLEDSQHPRTAYWDRFVRQVHAVCIHSEDLGVRFMCPDYSHLDGHDAPRFTELMHAELVRRNVLKANPADKPSQTSQVRFSDGRYQASSPVRADAKRVGRATVIVSS